MSGSFVITICHASVKIHLALDQKQAMINCTNALAMISLVMVCDIRTVDSLAETYARGRGGPRYG